MAGSSLALLLPTMSVRELRLSRTTHALSPSRKAEEVSVEWMKHRGVNVVGVQLTCWSEAVIAELNSGGGESVLVHLSYIPFPSTSRGSTPYTIERVYNAHQRQRAFQSSRNRRSYLTYHHHMMVWLQSDKLVS